MYYSRIVSSLKKKLKHDLGLFINSGQRCADYRQEDDKWVFGDRREIMAGV